MEIKRWEILNWGYSYPIKTKTVKQEYRFVLKYEETLNLLFLFYHIVVVNFPKSIIGINLLILKAEKVHVQQMRANTQKWQK